MKVAVLGAGSWGTAIASVFTQNGHDTTLYARRQNLADELCTMHTNHRYLPNIQLPFALSGTSHIAHACEGADLIVFSVPSAAMHELVIASSQFIPVTAHVAHAVKGFDGDTTRRMSELIETHVPQVGHRVVVIAGPSHAEEVVTQLPTTIVVASHSQSAAEYIQDAMMNQFFRVYTNPDVVGAEIGGSLKNIIALAVGIADGLGFGDNAKAALMTRGLAEIARLGIRMGASALTFSGLSGVGDLIVTCTSRHSRNFRTGRLLGQGVTLEEALRHVGMAVEGIPTTRVAFKLAQKFCIEMPITAVLHQVLFESKTPRSAVEELMGRARSHEVEEVAEARIRVQWREV